jgi:hypothetical protein
LIFRDATESARETELRANGNTEETANLMSLSVPLLAAHAASFSSDFISSTARDSIRLSCSPDDSGFRALGEN